MLGSFIQILRFYKQNFLSSNYSLDNDYLMRNEKPVKNIKQYCIILHTFNNFKKIFNCFITI